MNETLLTCFRAFERTAQENESLMERFIREVVQIYSPSKKKRIENLKQFGIVPINDTEMEEFVELEKKGLVIGFQDLNTHYFAISLSGIVEHSKHSEDWDTEKTLIGLSQCVGAELVKTLPKPKKIDIKEVSIFFFSLIVSDKEGAVDLNEEGFESECWDIFKGDFLDMLKNHMEAKSVNALEEKIRLKKSKHTNLEMFMKNTVFLTSLKVMNSKNKVYGFCDEEKVERFVDFLLQRSDLKSDFESRYSLAARIQELRQMAHLRCVIDSYESPFLSSAVRALQY